MRFADDQGMIASSESGLQRIMDSLNTTAIKYEYEYGMKINIKKTKVMRVSKEGGDVNIIINGPELEEVRSFKFMMEDVKGK